MLSQPLKFRFSPDLAVIADFSFVRVQVLQVKHASNVLNVAFRACFGLWTKFRISDFVNWPKKFGTPGLCIPNFNPVR